MGRFHQNSTDADEETSIDISPLIDCVFILLIFFIVTTTFVEEYGMPADKPQAAQAIRQEESTAITFRLSANGEVFFEGRKIGLSGIQPIVRSRLRADDAPVIIQAEPATRTSLLARVMDEARLAGATTVNFAARATKG